MTDSIKAMLAAVDRHLADMKDYGMNYAVADLRRAADEARPQIEGKQ
jgi:hypothetical protein